MLTAGYFSAVLGTEAARRRAVYVAQTLAFKAPVRIGDHAVTATCTVTAKDRRRVTLACVATVGETVVIEGEAVLLAPPAQGLTLDRRTPLRRLFWKRRAAASSPSAISTACIAAIRR